MNFNIGDKVLPKQYGKIKGKYCVNGLLVRYFGKQEYYIVLDVLYSGRIVLIDDDCDRLSWSSESFQLYQEELK